jgi:hypothetical protein
MRATSVVHEFKKCIGFRKLPLHPLRRYIFTSFFREGICIQLLTLKNQFQKSEPVAPLQPATSRYKIAWHLQSFLKTSTFDARVENIGVIDAKLLFVPT